ncbi:zinicin-like metallopeptidase [Georgenia soli]|uniref:Zinicin-like metallopeptidase n=1 Tax=Georgenia soli TaxID=638953 RepID=A0A2A9EIL2_9MICO|nr:metallopeptidase family protein [Georgenia soli]PFG38663.1 zinicin-like metallopeptidase [Georgenia soli]
MSESELPVPALPRRRGARRRDRRGRGLRGPLVPPTLPAWRTRADKFDDTVLRCVRRLEKRWPKELAGVEFAVEEVPPSDPAPWEHRTVALGRYFPADPPAGLTHRIVVYRRPVLARVEDAEETEMLVRIVLVEQVAGMLGRSPEDIDPEYLGD